jgi:hypothetical protein
MHWALIADVFANAASTAINVVNKASSSPALQNLSDASQTRANEVATRRGSAFPMLPT